MSFEHAEKAIQLLDQEFSSSGGKHDLNEATTRLRYIDRLVFECLGWERFDVSSEESQNDNVADYVMRNPMRTLIIEAKREGHYFALPTEAGVRKYTIDTLQRNSRDAYEAVEQCLRYCLEMGVPFGAVCNGYQVIGFLGSRTDGVAPLDGNVIAFRSLSDIAANFLLFWECFSKDGSASKRLLTELGLPQAAPLPHKMSANLSGYPGYKNRNSYQTELQILGDLVIEDIARAPELEPDFLQSCYCQTGALSQYALISRQILQTRYSAQFEKLVGGPSMEPVSSKKGLNPAIVEQALSRRPILLIGDVGVGKTMFIRHFINIDAKELAGNAVLLYLDFGTKPALTIDLPTYIADQIIQQLDEDHKIDVLESNFVEGVYHGEMQKFDRSVFGQLRNADPSAYKAKRLQHLSSLAEDPEKHLPAALTHISKAHKKQIILFLDNVDQRNDEFQQLVFLTAQSMASGWPVIVFLSLRPETYYKSRNGGGALDAYHPRAFTIAPPRVDLVLQKRLTYAVKLLEEGRLSSLGQTVVNIPSLTNYFKILEASFQENEYLIEFVDNMCGGNIRLALEYVRAFVGSGHVDTSKIVREGSLQLHEFLRAVIYQDHEYYYPLASPIANVFDISENDEREYFLLCITLAALERLGQPHVREGYVPYSDIANFVQAMGYHPTQVNSALTRAVQRKLMERIPRDTDEAMLTDRSYRCNTVGSYYWRRLVSTFTYVDAMIVDTPVLNETATVSIQDVPDIDSRLLRAELFCDYLDGVWERHGLKNSVFDWPGASKGVRKEIERISRSISA